MLYKLTSHMWIDTYRDCAVVRISGKFFLTPTGEIVEWGDWMVDNMMEVIDDKELPS